MYSLLLLLLGLTLPLVCGRFVLLLYLIRPLRLLWLWLWLQLWLKLRLWLWLRMRLRVSVEHVGKVVQFLGDGGDLGSEGWLMRKLW
jgi:hypothetical protein